MVNIFKDAKSNQVYKVVKTFLSEPEKKLSCLKDEEGKTLLEESEIAGKWKRYIPKRKFIYQQNTK